MIKFLLTVGLMFSLPAMAVKRTPDAEQGVEYGIDIRLLRKIRRFILLVETKNRKELGETNYHQLMVGSYYRLTKRFRVGFFLQGEKGLRWDADWEKATVWDWDDIGSRWDFSSVFDVTYNDLLSKNWIWEFKSRFLYYHSRDALLWKPRPGLRYFFLKHGQPLWQIYSEIEAYVPVNYGESSIYEYWIYLGALYQATSQFSIGPVISYRERWFHSYANFEDKTGLDYKSPFSSVYLGLSAVYNW